MWRAHSVKGIAYHQHLYTQLAHGAESDSVERWLADYVDAPSEHVLAEVARDSKLKPADRDVLLRFFAASQSRTPAFYLRRQAVWNRDMHARIHGVLKSLVEKMDRGQTEPAEPTQEAPPQDGVGVPSRLRVRENPNGEGGIIEAEVLMGRGLWFFEIRRMVEHTWKNLRKLDWTILRPPPGVLWLTSDDPAVVARISDGTVTFNGGWLEAGSVLLLPLDPEHVLYGKLNGPVPVKYSEASGSDAEFIQNCITRHSHRMVFGREKDHWVPTVQPRRVDPNAYDQERNEWRIWHPTHAKAEADLEDNSTWHVPGGEPA
jgi:hypothetical protein